MQGIEVVVVLKVFIGESISWTDVYIACVQCQEPDIEVFQLLLDQGPVLTELGHASKVCLDSFRLYLRVSGLDLAQLVIDLVKVARHDADVEALLRKLLAYL